MDFTQLIAGTERGANDLLSKFQLVPRHISFPPNRFEYRIASTDEKPTAENFVSRSLRTKAVSQGGSSPHIFKAPKPDICR